MLLSVERPKTSIFIQLKAGVKNAIRFDGTYVIYLSSLTVFFNIHCTSTDINLFFFYIVRCGFQDSYKILTGFINEY